ncbi:MAG: UDP-N-acetylglucosamine 2-epimerase [Patescibacteria group bacterium]|nr:UDP-N-acetylglucosamine 2-epimerase [Patescibacteria group bacterium]
MKKDRVKSKKKSTIAIVIGTKAELIKCMPLMLELSKQKKEYWFIHTGQHPLGKACEEFGIKKPDFILSKEPEISTKFWSRVNKTSSLWFIQMILKIRKLLKKLKPNYVIYHGDTMSTAAASMASGKLLNRKKTWKNVHLEAGLRSGSMFEPFPEEISRRISDGFSDILLAVSDLTEDNLRKDSRLASKEIKKLGNTIVDSAAITHDKAKKIYKKLPYEYALINLHRHENLKNKKRLGDSIKILENIKIRAIWPLHDNTEYHLKKYGLLKKLKKLKNIKITPLTNYFEFIFLLANCKYLITDGGSIQEESLIFNKPCILIRRKTERQEGLSTGINFLTGLNINYAKNIIKKIENNEINVKKFKNPYGERGVTKNILKNLR